MAADYKNILIMKPSSLGDIVLALPALSALRRSLPRAKISWLIRPEFAPLLESHPHLDGIIPFDRHFLAKAWYSPKAFGALLSLIRQLRRGRFDAAFDFQGLFRTAVLAWLSGCTRRFGMSNAREFAGLFYTDKVPQDADCIHLVDYYLKIVRAAGAGQFGVEFELPVESAEIEASKKLLADCNVDPHNYVVLVPGSAHTDKRWPVERYAALADKIAERFNVSLVGVGAASEYDIVETLRAACSRAVVNVAGRTSLKQLVAILKAARLVVSNDTGPGHIAAALGVPLVMIYSWSNPARIAPYARADCMVAREPYSRGLNIRSSDPKHNVANITIEEVFDKVCRQIEKATN